MKQQIRNNVLRKPNLASHTHIRIEKSKVLQRRSLHKKLIEFAQLEKSLHSGQKLFLVVLILGMMILYLLIWFVQTRSKLLTVQTEDLTSEVLNSSQVSEGTVTINQVSRYKTEPNLPRRITIPRIGIETLIRPVTANATGLPNNPRNINETAWLNTSAKFGEPGVTLISGYIRGPTKKGVFHDVDVLIPGDSIKVLRGDSTQLSYKITNIHVFKKATLTSEQAMALEPGQVNSLHLITTIHEGGIATEFYENEFLITAQLIQ